MLLLEDYYSNIVQHYISNLKMPALVLISKLKGLKYTTLLFQSEVMAALFSCLLTWVIM